MKVAAFVLLLAVAGLLVVGAVDAKRMGPCEKPKMAVATASADACATGNVFAATNTCTDTYANTCGCCVAAGSASGSSSVAM